MLAMLRFFAQNTIEEYKNIPEITDKAKELLAVLDKAEALQKELTKAISTHDPEIARIKDEMVGRLLMAMEEQNKNLN